MNLWEYQHDYYCNLENYNGQTSQKYENWGAFLSEFKDVDRDYNLLFRWDWKTTDGPGFNRTHSLELFFIQQRKGAFVPILIENVSIYEQDEVIEFLRPYWEKLKGLWQPFSGV